MQEIPPEIWTKIFSAIGSWLAKLNLISLFRKSPNTLHFHAERKFWSTGSVNGQPGMQIDGHWRVTNVTDEACELWDIQVRFPLFSHRGKVINSFVVVRHPHSNIYGSRHPILPHATSEASSHIWIAPPTRKAGRDLVLTIVFIDQFKRRHKQRRVRFQGMRPMPIEAEPITEALHSLSSPLEKDVAAILKSEVTRYRANGRIRGGLGSLIIIVQGRRMESTFTDWRREGVGSDQSIAPDPDQVRVESDNFERLHTLYRRQSTDGERESFKGMLLKRLNKDGEYAPVAYLIVWFFVVENGLGTCLEAAIQGLSTETKFPGSKNALSDALRLLDLFLHYQPQLFDENRLDQLEAALGQTDEHPFRIQERIAAIRASRI